MTSAQLKSIAAILDEGATVFSSSIDQDLITVLSNLDPTAIKIICTILNISIADFTAAIPNIISLLNAANGLFTTNEHIDISNFCRALANRPLLLAILAKLI